MRFFLLVVLAIIAVAMASSKKSEVKSSLRSSSMKSSSKTSKKAESSSPKTVVMSALERYQSIMGTTCPILERIADMCDDQDCADRCDITNFETECNTYAVIQKKATKNSPATCTCELYKCGPNHTDDTTYPDNI